MHDKVTLRRRHFHANGIALVGDTTCCGQSRLRCRPWCVGAWRGQADELALGRSLQGLAPFVDHIRVQPVSDRDRGEGVAGLEALGKDPLLKLAGVATTALDDP